MTENQKQKKIIELCLRMNDSGLNQGTSGKISERQELLMMITPGGIPYDRMTDKDIAKPGCN